MSLRVVILAAGQGTRMRSDLAKVLHPLEGTSLLSHVLRTAASLSPERTVVVVGHQWERVRAEHEGWGVDFVLQEPQRGTGHAVQQAEAFLRDHDGTTLVLYGDVPLLRRSTLLELLEEHADHGDAVTVLTARVQDPCGYGRMIRDPEGRLAAIVEDKDLAPEQQSVEEINSGIYAFRTPDLRSVLFELSDHNKQRELYLTDTVAMLRLRGRTVGTYALGDPLEISGINTPEQLAEAAAVLARRRAEGAEDCPTCSWIAGVSEGAFPVLLSRMHAVLAVAKRPYNSGQLVVHPRRHVLRHVSLDDAERADLWDLARVASRAVQEVYHPAGMNLGYTAGGAGEHLALQVIPRWVGDTNFLPILVERTLLPEALEQTHSRLLEALRTAGDRS